MATTLKPPKPAWPAERALRIPPIAVNLLPLEIIESRRVRKVRRIVVVALVAFVVLLAGWYAQTSYQTSTARSKLRTAEGDAARLQRQQHAFDDVVGTQEESRAIGAQLSNLLANDLQWSRLLSSLRKAAPPGVMITGVFGTLTARSNAAAVGAGGTGGPASNSAGASQLPSASGEKSIGTFTITGSGLSKADVAAYVDALAKVPGLGNPLLGDATLQNGELHFTVRLDITKSALGGRYTSASGTGAVKR
jgi:Tfp pilus assembly protein PilN